MKRPKLEWELKDASRGYWYIQCKSRGVEYSKTEEGFYETIWSVRIKTGKCQRCHRMKFTVETQYDQPISLTDVWRAVQEHMGLFTEAALIAEGAGK